MGSPWCVPLSHLKYFVVVSLFMMSYYQINESFAKSITLLRLKLKTVDKLSQKLFECQQ